MTRVKPIVFPLGKTEQKKITEQLSQAAGILGSIPGLAWLPNVVTTALNILKPQSEAERQSTIWKKVYDTKSYRWHEAHNMDKATLERYMNGLKDQIQNVIPAKQAKGDVVAPRYLAPYTFLYSEFDKIHTLKFKSNAASAVSGVQNVVQGALGGNLGSLGKALLYGAVGFMIFKMVK